MKKAVSLCIAVAAAAPAAATDWPMYGFDVRQTRFNRAETAIHPDNVMKLQPAWFFKTEGAVSATPAVATIEIGAIRRTVLYIGSWDHNFYALDANTGKELWRVTLATPQGDNSTSAGPGGFPGIQSSAAVAEGRVYFGDSCGYLHAYPANGDGAQSDTMTVRNRGCGSTGTESAGFPVDLGGALPANVSANCGLMDNPCDAVSTDIYSSPIPFTPKHGANAGRKMIYVGAASHRDGPCIHGALFAIDAITGHIVWRFDVVPQSSIGGGVWSTPAIDDVNDLVYIDTGDCVNNASAGLSESIIALDASCSGVTVDGSCFHLPPVSYSPQHRNGNPVWAFQSHPNGEIADFDFGSSPNVISDSTGTPVLVGAGSKDGVYYAVKAGPDGGQLVWKTEIINLQTDVTTVTIGNSIGTILGGFQGSTGFAYDTIFATTFSGPEFAPALHASSGNLKWDGLDALSSFSSVGIANGLVFAGDNLGFLKARDAQTGIPLFLFPTGGAISGGPVIVDGRVFVGVGLFGSQTGLPETQGVYAFKPPGS